MKLLKYNKDIDDPHSWDSYQAQKPCWVPIVRQVNHKEVYEASLKGEKLEPIYVPTRPILVCNCGQLVGLCNHSVSETGQVQASFYHKKGTGKHEDPHGCEWHVFVELDEYSGRNWPRLADGEQDD